MNPMHHPIAGEPVIGRRVRSLDRVRSIAQEATTQFDGQRSDHGQICRRHLGDHRREVAHQIRIGGHSDFSPPSRATLPIDDVSLATYRGALILSMERFGYAVPVPKHRPSPASKSSTMRTPTRGATPTVTPAATSTAAVSVNLESPTAPASTATSSSDTY